MPAISVIIPLYNKEDYILRTIDSVLKQSFEDFELLIMNDGSTDGSVALVEAVDDARIRIISHENIGLSATRNEGAKHALSDLVAFVDADDTWKPDFLLTIMDLYGKYPQAAAFATNYERIFPDGSRRPASVFGIDDLKGDGGIMPDFFKMALYEVAVHPSAVAVKKSVMEETAGFLKGVRYGEDQEFFARLALRYPFAYSKKVEGEYYKDLENSITQAANHFDMPIIELYKDYKSDANLNSQQEYYLEEYINRIRLDKCFWALMKGKGTLAKKLLKDSQNTELFKEKWSRYNLISKIPHSLYMAFRKLKYVLSK